MKKLVSKPVAPAAPVFPSTPSCPLREFYLRSGLIELGLQDKV